MVNTVTAAKKYSDLGGKRLYSCQPAFLDRWEDFKRTCACPFMFACPKGLN